MISYADQIKSSVTMREVAELYGLSVNRQHKALCPFHQDSKPSLHIYDGQKGYFCFVCNHGGDVIDFVQRMFGLSFPDAEKKLNDDFHLRLPIGETLSEEKRREANRAAYQRRKEQERRKQRHSELVRAYHTAFDRWACYDKAMIENAPETPYDDLSEKYAEACKKIDAAWFAVESALSALTEFERTH